MIELQAEVEAVRIRGQNETFEQEFSVQSAENIIATTRQSVNWYQTSGEHWADRW